MPVRRRCLPVHPVRQGDAGVGHQANLRPLPPGQGKGGADGVNPPGPAGHRIAPGRCCQHPGGQRCPPAVPARFNAQFAVAAEQPEKAYRPVSAELALTETICLKHPRKVGETTRSNTTGGSCNCFPGWTGLAMPASRRRSWNGPTALMIGYHGETVDFQESPQPLSSLWGALPGSLGPELQPIADDPANGHLSHAQRTLLAHGTARRVSAKRVVTKVGRGAVKPVRHSLHRTPTLTQQARWEAVQQAKRQGLSLSPASWACHA